jgi:hypothetical protein
MATIDLPALTKLLGLPADQQSAVASFVGDPDRDSWTEAEAAELVETWRRTCGKHGVYDCGECPAASVKYPDVTVQLTGVDGNAMLIVGRVAKAIRRVHGNEAATAYVNEATSGSYDDLLQVTMRTVEVE